MIETLCFISFLLWLTELGVLLYLVKAIHKMEKDRKTTEAEWKAQIEKLNKKGK